MGYVCSVCSKLWLEESHLESPGLPLEVYQPCHASQNAETNGKYLTLYILPIVLLTYPQLSKEDEVATGSDEIEVRREDQDKINKFSRLHQRELNLEDELKAKHVRVVIQVAEVRKMLIQTAL